MIARLTVDGLEQLLALVLPLEISNPDLLGDDLQLVPGCVAFLPEPTGVTVGVAGGSAGGLGGVGPAG